MPVLSSFSYRQEFTPHSTATSNLQRSGAEQVNAAAPSSAYPRSEKSHPSPANPQLQHSKPWATASCHGKKRRFGVVVFPGSWSDADCHYALGTVLGQEVRYLWHKDDFFNDVDCVILPGGFSYGDYLRPGAIARLSPIMSAVARFAGEGGIVLGICNGFQMLCEAGLLPGVLMRNNHLQFRCQWTHLRVERHDSPFTRSGTPGGILRIPISHGEGRYYADAATLQTLETQGRILFRYCTPEGEVTAASNPNGSLNNIAGICNSAGNVVGMMPHPERCCEKIMGGVDGLSIFGSIIDSLAKK